MKTKVLLWCFPFLLYEGFRSFIDENFFGRNEALHIICWWDGFFEVIAGWMQHHFDTCKHWKFDIDNINIKFVFIMERMNKYSKNIMCRLFDGKMDMFSSVLLFFRWISYKCWSDWINLFPIHKMIIEFFPFFFCKPIHLLE